MIITSLWTDTNRVSNTGKFSQVLADSNKNRIVQEFNQRCTSFRCWAQNGSRKVLLSKAVGLLHCCWWLNLMPRSDVGDWSKILLTCSDAYVGGQLVIVNLSSTLQFGYIAFSDRWWWQNVLVRSLSCCQLVGQNFDNLVTDMIPVPTSL